MTNQSRVHKGILNAKVNLVYYFLFIILSLFSRKIFLECLGPDFLGLSGTLVEILGFLSLAEMGVGAAVGFKLYKPLQEEDHKTTEELVSVFGYIYRKIGIFIVCAAAIISLFLPLIFKSSTFSLPLIYFAYFTILSSSIFSYFINYKQIILTADQKAYVVTAFTQGCLFVKILIQIAVCLYWGNYYAWLILEMVYGVTSCIILNIQIKRTYPWLDASVRKGKDFFPQHKEILKLTKQVFVHKIKDYLLFRSDQILIFAFVSLKMVAFYGNYTLIVSRLTQMFTAVLGSLNAGVGNLVAEGNKQRILSVFWEICTINYIVAGIVCFSLYVCIEPFITIWLGPKYILGNTVLILLLITTFIQTVRSAVDQFNSAYGHYADVWAAYTEGGLNIGTTVLTAPFWGISGILTGKIVSLFLIVILWKPYYLFRDGFQLPIIDYCKGKARLLTCYILAFAAGIYLNTIIPIDAASGWLFWILKAAIVVGGYTIIYSVLLYFISPGAKQLVARLIKKH